MVQVTLDEDTEGAEGTHILVVELHMVLPEGMAVGRGACFWCCACGCACWYLRQRWCGDSVSPIGPI